MTLSHGLVTLNGYNLATWVNPACYDLDAVYLNNYNAGRTTIRVAPENAQLADVVNLNMGIAD